MPGPAQPPDGQKPAPETNVTAQESNLGAIATAHSEPLVQPREQPQEQKVPDPDLADILDHQFGPLPRDLNNYFESDRALQAFTAYLQNHGIMRSGGQGSAGAQHVFLWNVLEDTWRRIQDELKKKGAGSRYMIDRLLKQIRERVKEYDENHTHWQKSKTRHDAEAKQLEEQFLKYTRDQPEGTPGIFKGGAGSVLKPGLFRRLRAKEAPKGTWGTGEHIPEELRGKRLPEVPASVTQHWENISKRVQGSYVARSKRESEAPLYTSELLGPPMDFSTGQGKESYFRERKKKKAGFFMEDLHRLNSDVEQRMRAADVLFGLKQRFERYQASRKKQHRDWKTNNPEAVAALDKARREYGVARQAEKEAHAAYKAKTKPSDEEKRAHRDLIAALNERESKSHARLQALRRKQRSPLDVMPVVHPNIREELKRFYIKDKRKSKRHYLINRLVESNIKEPAHKDDIALFRSLADQLKQSSDAQRQYALPSSLQHHYFRHATAATLARTQYQPKGKIDPALQKRALETVAALEKHGDLKKWRSLRDYLQMYDKMIPKDTVPHLLIQPNMPWGMEGGKAVVKTPNDMQRYLSHWTAEHGKIHAKDSDRVMVYPRWDSSKEAFVLKPSKVPFGTNAYPRQAKGEGGIFSDFLTRADLAKVVRDLNIKVPDAPHDAVYDEMKLTDERNKVYKPFLQQLSHVTHDTGLKVAKASNFWKDFTTKDVRMYEAVMRKLQAYRALDIDHTRLNEVADFYDTRSNKFDQQLRKARKQSLAIQREIRHPRFPKATLVAERAALKEHLAATQKIFERQVAARGTAAVYHKPSQKKIPGQQLQNPILQAQGTGFGRADWRALLRINNSRYNHLYDGHQANQLRIEYESIRDKIKALGFGFKRHDQHGYPHVGDINRIGHLENLRRLIGPHSLDRAEQAHYDALEQSFTNPNVLDIPANLSRSRELRRLAGEHIAVYQELANSTGRSNVVGFDTNEKWADAASGGSGYFARRPPAPAPARPAPRKRPPPSPQKGPGPQFVPGKDFVVNLKGRKHNIGSFRTHDEYKRVYAQVLHEFQRVAKSKGQKRAHDAVRSLIRRHGGTYREKVQRPRVERPPKGVSQAEWLAIEERRKDAIHQKKVEEDLAAEEAAQTPYRPKQGAREYAARGPPRRSARASSSRIPTRLHSLFERRVQEMRERLPAEADVPTIRKAWRGVLESMQQLQTEQEHGHGKLPFQFDLRTFPLPDVFRTKGRQWKQRIKHTGIFPSAGPRGHPFQPGVPLKLRIAMTPPRPTISWVKPEPSPSPQPEIAPPRPKKGAPPHLRPKPEPSPSPERVPPPPERAPPEPAQPAEPEQDPAYVQALERHKQEWEDAQMKYAEDMKRYAEEVRLPSKVQRLRELYALREKFKDQIHQLGEYERKFNENPRLYQDQFNPEKQAFMVTKDKAIARIKALEAQWKDLDPLEQELDPRLRLKELINTAEMYASFSGDLGERAKAELPTLQKQLTAVKSPTLEELLKNTPKPRKPPTKPVEPPKPTPPKPPKPETAAPATVQQYREPDPEIDIPDTRPGTPVPEYTPDYGEMPDLEHEDVMQHIMKMEGAGANYLNPVNLTGIPFGMSSHHRTAVVARNVPQRPLFHAEDVNVTDLIHRFENLEMPSRVHMVQASSHVVGHIMHDMWEDVNMGQRRARERHGRTGPFAKRKGRSRVMSKSANVQGRSRGKLYEATIQRKVTQYELEMVMKKLRVHMRSSVGSLLFLHFGKSKKLLGDLTDIDLEELKKMIRRKLQRHSKIGLEVTDARMGGALHNPITHSAQFTRTLL